LYNHRPIYNIQIQASCNSLDLYSINCTLLYGGGVDDVDDDANEHDHNDNYDKDATTTRIPANHTQ